jgi:hypothetical protein
VVAWNSRRELALAVLHDLREHRVSANAEEFTDFETDVLTRFVLARAWVGLADSTIRNDTGHLELIRGLSGQAAVGAATRRR